MSPPLSRVDLSPTHRTIPSKYSQGSVLEPIARPEDLPEVFELDDLTNDRLVRETWPAPGIHYRELVWGVPNEKIIRAAYLHAHPLGGRFNSPGRGAWYGSDTIEGAIAEIAFHKTVELAEIGYPAQTITYDDWIAEFHANFHDLRAAPEFAECLSPTSYRASQQLAQELLASGSNGIIYPNVRLAGATNVVCFRPPLVGNVRKGKTLALIWKRNESKPLVARNIT